jgi:phosphonopyruvate decarboxylase
MQMSHTSLGTDLVGVAKACNLDWAQTVTDINEVSQIAQFVNAKNGVGLANVLIQAHEYPKALPASDGVYIKNRFRATLGLETF